MSLLSPNHGPHSDLLPLRRFSGWTETLRARVFDELPVLEPPGAPDPDEWRGGRP